MFCAMSQPFEKLYANCWVIKQTDMVLGIEWHNNGNARAPTVRFLHTSHLGLDQKVSFIDEFFSGSFSGVSHGLAQLAGIHESNALIPTLSLHHRAPNGPLIYEPGVMHVFSYGAEPHTQKCVPHSSDTKYKVLKLYLD